MRRCGWWMKRNLIQSAPRPTACHPCPPSYKPHLQSATGNHTLEMALTLAHPWFLLLLLLLPVAAWWRGRQGKPAAVLYSSVQLVSGVANISRASAGRALAALRWLTLALFIIGLARAQFGESETA